MKKLLLGTTAVLGSLALAVPAQAAPLELTLGGELGYQLGYVSEDLDTDTNEIGSERLSELTLNAEGTSANGLTYGGDLTLYVDRFDGNDDILYLASIYGQNEFGRLEGGNQESVTSQMAIFAPSDFGTGGIAGDYLNFVSGTLGTSLFRRDGNTDLVTLERSYLQLNSDESNKLNYISPVFAGFQFGFTFAPSGDDTGRGVNRSDTLAVTSSSRALENFNNIWEVAVAYRNEFNGVGFGIAGGYVGGSAKDSGVTAYEDLRTYQIGLELSYQGFTVGGAYVDNGDSGYLTSATNDESFTSWNAGIQYETGPFVVGFNYLDGTNAGDTTSAVENELTAYSGGITYVVAEGLSTYGEVTYFDSKTSVAAENNEGTVFIIGSRLAF